MRRFARLLLQSTKRYSKKTHAMVQISKTLKKSLKPPASLQQLIGKYYWNDVVRAWIKAPQREGLPRSAASHPAGSHSLNLPLTFQASFKRVTDLFIYLIILSLPLPPILCLSLTFHHPHQCRNSAQIAGKRTCILYRWTQFYWKSKSDEIHLLSCVYLGLGGGSIKSIVLKCLRLTINTPSFTLDWMDLAKNRHVSLDWSLESIR